MASFMEIEETAAESPSGERVSADARIKAIEEKTLAPLGQKITPRTYLIWSFLAATLLWGVLAWGWQIFNGMKVTGLNSPVFWGLYIVNFVFFIGVSHAGTLISSILRITEAHWRTPFTRVAEAITIASLPFAGTSVLVDIGRPDRLFNIFLYPHLSSPILWDVICISTYMGVSCLYFYVALIPDLALCRDRLKGVEKWRAALYRLAAVGWKNTSAEKKLHDRVMSVMSVVLLTLVISVHTNVGFMFGMTSKPGWHTAAIGPYFVIGAAFQGLGALAVIIVLIRKAFKLETIITPAHLGQLKKFFLAMACFWAYFTFTEFLTIYYGQHTAETAVLWEKLTGRFAIPFWSMLSLCLFIPFPLLVFGRGDISRILLWAGLSVNIGMWLERFCIVVPSAAMPMLPWQKTVYSPSWVEWSVTVGWFAGFVLCFLILARLLPVLTLWEFREETD